MGFYPKADSYKHEASEIKFDNPDTKRFPRFKDVEWQRIDLAPGDGTDTHVYIYMYIYIYMYNSIFVTKLTCRIYIFFI